MTKRTGLIAGTALASMAFIRGAYAASCDMSFSYSGTIESCTVASSGVYNFSLAGGSGGKNYTGYGSQSVGYGGIVNGSFYLTANTVLQILVGGAGGSSAGFGSGAGGGGGSFVTQDLSLLAVAGGGGGASYYDGAGGGGGSEDTSGMTFSGGQGGVAYGLASYASGGGGGGGFSGDGADGLFENSSTAPTAGDNTGGDSFLNGGAGGTRSSVQNGGFGGGGSGGTTGGGGGGATGGDGGTGVGVGSGGTSFLASSALTRSFLIGDTLGNGYVNISRASTPPTVPLPGAAGMLAAAVAALGLARRKKKAAS